MRYFALMSKNLQSFLYQNEKNTDNYKETIDDAENLLNRTILFGLLMTFLSLFTITGFAAHTAVVRTPTAIIYADIDLKAPIGQLSQGTKLKIAEVLRRRGTVALSTHQNKIVYLKSSDLTISGVKDQLEVQASRFKVIETIAAAQDPKPHRASINIYAGRGIPGSSWATLADQMQSNETQSFYTLGVGAKINPYSSRYAIGINMESTNSFDPQVQMQAFSLDLSFAYALLNNDFLSWEVFAGPGMSPNVLIQTENKQYFTKGAGYGYRLGTEVHLLKLFSYHLSAGLLYRYQKLSGHEKILLPGLYRQETSLNNFSEYRLYLSLNRELNLNL